MHERSRNPAPLTLSDCKMNEGTHHRPDGVDVSTVKEVAVEKH